MQTTKWKRRGSDHTHGWIPKTADFFASGALMHSKTMCLLGEPTIGQLHVVALTNTMTSASCERGFSRCNLTKDSTRNTLKIDSVNKCMMYSVLREGHGHSSHSTTRELGPFTFRNWKLHEGQCSSKCFWKFHDNNSVLILFHLIWCS